MSDAPPPGGYQPPQPPPAPGYQPPPAQPSYQAPPAQPTYQAPPVQPAYQQPAQFQPVNPGASSSGNGCLKAFLIVGGISAVLGIVIVIAAVFLVGNAVDDVVNDPSLQFGTADASDYEVTIDTCTVGDFGLLEATGTITNKDSVRRAYSINVDFNDPDNANLKLGSSTDSTSGLTTGQSEAWSITGSATGEPTAVECKVAQVSYFGD